MIVFALAAIESAGRALLPAKRPSLRIVEGLGVAAAAWCSFHGRRIAEAATMSQLQAIDEPSTSHRLVTADLDAAWRDA
jgi:hypothetical protein